MAFDLPPIAKLAERLQLDIEQAVRGFPRYHRYAGHFRHAHSHRLQRSLQRRFPWLASATANRSYAAALEGRVVTVPTLRSTHE